MESVECRLGVSIVATCCQLSSTDDLHHFITLRVHLCIQHNAREVARRAGPSATTDTCDLITLTHTHTHTHTHHTRLMALFPGLPR